MAMRSKALTSSLDDARRRHRAEALFREHGEFLRRLAAALCRSRLDPDDLLQDVLERTVLYCDSLGEATNHRAWMARVMRNMFIDRLRRLAAKPPPIALDDDPRAPELEPGAWWERLDADDVRARLAELPGELREAFELFELEGCSYDEIAKRLGVPKMTVGTRILRARRRLKQLLVASHDREVGDV